MRNAWVNRNTSRRRVAKVALMTVIWLSVFVSCGHKSGESERNENDFVIAEIGDSVLYDSDVTKRIPKGLSATERNQMYESIVSNWVETRLLRVYAEENLTNLSELDELVERFRTQLIVDEYKRQMKYASVELPEDTIKHWYETHKSSYVAERPLVKGVFLKMPQRGRYRDRIIKLVTSDDPKDLDVFENEMLDNAAQYSYFKDEWIDWDVVASLIPYNFEDANNFISTHKSFTTDYNEMTYVLAISDKVLAGEPLPYEYAEHIIREYLTERSADREERKIIKSIYDKAIKEGRLKISMRPLPKDKNI